MIVRSQRTDEIPQSGAGWAHDVVFWLDDARTQARALVSGTAELRRAGGAASAPPPPLACSVGNGRIQITGNRCGVRLSAGDVAGLEPGVYELVVDVVDDEAWPTQVRKPIKVVP